MTTAYMQRAATRIGISLADYQANVERGLKWCFRCRRFQARSEFGPSDAHLDSLRNECREAINVRTRAAMRRLYWRRKGAVAS